VRGREDAAGRGGGGGGGGGAAFALINCESKNKASRFALTPCKRGKN